MSPAIFLVDAFADRPFTGNPAAVCLVPGWPAVAWMQSIATEMNQAETAFVWKRSDGMYPLRWFTPTVEVDLCGHATLASAHVLWSNGLATAEEVIRFETKSGILTASRKGDEIELDFPVKPAVAADPPPGLLEALEVRAPRFVGRNQFDYLVEVESEAVLRAIAPDFRQLRQVECRGVIVTARGEDGRTADFVSRFFAPAAGVDEDPVTGSAHCCLAAYWSRMLDRSELTGYQASRRGGFVRVRLAGDRVHLGGRAVSVMTGIMQVPGGDQPADAPPLNLKS
jgi:PhzF family phenazine biosynthesis protein